MTDENKPPPKPRWQTIAKRWGQQARMGGIDLGWTVACYVDASSKGGGHSSPSHVTGEKVTISRWAKESGCSRANISYHLRAWDIFAEMQGFEDPAFAADLTPDSEMPRELRELLEPEDDEDDHTEQLRRE